MLQFQATATNQQQSITHTHSNSFMTICNNTFMVFDQYPPVSGDFRNGLSGKGLSRKIRPLRQKLQQVGIPCGGHRARQLTRADYRDFDYIIGMDEANRRNMLRMLGGDPAGKVSLLLDGTPRPRPIADPWYTGDFEATYQDVLEGCTALLNRL